MPQQRKTLTRYSIECEHRHPGSTGDFSGLLDSLATAVKIISNQVAGVLWSARWAALGWRTSRVRSRRSSTSSATR